MGQWEPQSVDSHWICSKPQLKFMTCLVQVRRCHRHMVNARVTRKTSTVTLVLADLGWVVIDSDVPKLGRYLNIN